MYQLTKTLKLVIECKSLNYYPNNCFTHYDSLVNFAEIKINAQREP